jgi:hypothetical protein
LRFVSPYDGAESSRRDFGTSFDQKFDCIGKDGRHGFARRRELATGTSEKSCSIP